MMSKYKSRSKIINLLLISFIAGFTNCKKENHKKNSSNASRMVLVYIAANNDLISDAISSINNLELGAKDLKGQMLVFVKTNTSNSYLLKIKYDIGDKIVSDTLKTYLTQSSSDGTFLKEVIKDSRSYFPAKTYGLIMWSHGTSWVPPITKTKSFGSDNGKEMDIKDLKKALFNDFEFIMFDACYMGSLEVVYELKDKAKFIIASSSEVLSSSFPYHKISQYLFTDSTDLVKAAKSYVDYYSEFSGKLASATVSITNTKELDNLASLTREILPSIELRTKITDVQELTFEANPRANAYDFLDFIQNYYKPQEYNIIKSQLEKVVLFKANTKCFFNVPMKTFCGLSIYLPIKKPDLFKDYYSSLSWYTASGWNKLFK